MEARGAHAEIHDALSKARSDLTATDAHIHCLLESLEVVELMRQRLQRDTSKARNER